MNRFFFEIFHLRLSVIIFILTFVQILHNTLENIMVILFGNWLTSHRCHEANMISVSCMYFRLILDLRNVPNKNVERRKMTKTLEYLLFFDYYVRPALRIIVTNSALIFYFKLLVQFFHYQASLLVIHP